MIIEESKHNPLMTVFENLAEDYPSASEASPTKSPDRFSNTTGLTANSTNALKYIPNVADPAK
jgi:hypothetical protein